MNKLILYVCAWICLHSCGFSKSQEESMLEYALSQAGDNRKELEYVIKYYEGDSLKREAARFLIRNMVYHFGYEKRERVSDITTLSSDYLIRNIELAFQAWAKPWNKSVSFENFCRYIRKYSINSLVYWVTYVHNVVYSFYRSMIYCYINSTQRCAGSIVIDIIPTNGADKRKFFPFAPYFPVTNVIKRYFYPYFPAIIGIKGYSFPYFPYLSGIMKIKTALYSLFSRLDWHKTVVFPCLGEIYEGIRSLSWEIPVT